MEKVSTFVDAGGYESRLYKALAVCIMVNRTDHRQNGIHARLTRGFNR